MTVHALLAIQGAAGILLCIAVIGLHHRVSELEKNDRTH
jgi:hypothetical protein